MAPCKLPAAKGKASNKMIVIIDDTFRQQRNEVTVNRNLLQQILSLCGDLTIQRTNFVLVAGVNASGLLLTWRFVTGQRFDLASLECWQRKLDTILGVQIERRKIEVRRRAMKINLTTENHRTVNPTAGSSPLEARLRKIIADSGMTSNAIAHGAGVSVAVLYKFVGEPQKHLRIDTAEKLFSFFGEGLMEKPAA
jgi:hypothetical protein